MHLSQQPYGDGAWVELALIVTVAVAGLIVLLSGVLIYSLRPRDPSRGGLLRPQSEVYREVVWQVGPSLEPLLPYPWLPRSAALRWSFVVGGLMAAGFNLIQAPTIGYLEILLAPFMALPE